MTIYTRGGAPVEIIKAYRGHGNGGGFYLIQAKILGPYPDGSGKEDIGTILFHDSPTLKGWACVADFNADGGLPEFMDAARAAPEETPKNAAKLMNYYWPSVFDKQGNRKERG